MAERYDIVIPFGVGKEWANEIREKIADKTGYCCGLIPEKIREIYEE